MIEEVKEMQSQRRRIIVTALVLGALALFFYVLTLLRHL